MIHITNTPTLNAYLDNHQKAIDSRVSHRLVAGIAIISGIALAILFACSIAHGDFHSLLNPTMQFAVITLPATAVIVIALAIIYKHYTHEMSYLKELTSIPALVDALMYYEHTPDSSSSLSCHIQEQFTQHEWQLTLSLLQEKSKDPKHYMPLFNACPASFLKSYFNKGIDRTSTNIPLQSLILNKISSMNRSDLIEFLTNRSNVLFTLHMICDLFNYDPNLADKHFKKIVANHSLHVIISYYHLKSLVNIPEKFKKIAETHIHEKLSVGLSITEKEFLMNVIQSEQKQKIHDHKSLIEALDCKASLERSRIETTNNF